MKIRRFLEAQEGEEVQGPKGVSDLVNDVSSNRINFLLKEISKILSTVDDNLTTLKKFEKELLKYKSPSKKSNDQIDDTVSLLQQMNSDLENEIKSKLDTVIDNLNDYKDNGRNYIY